MLTIVIGILVAVGLIFLAAHIGKGISFFSTLAVLSLLASIIMGLFAPLSGYNEWQLVQETELVTLSNSVATQGEGFIYVSLSADNVYTYRYEIDSEFGTETSKEYETKTISDNVEEIEDPNCQVPVLWQYIKTGKRSIWTFAICAEIKNVFYVPEGTISKEIKLK